MGVRLVHRLQILETVRYRRRRRRSHTNPETRYLRGRDIEYRAVGPNDYWRAYAVLRALDQHRDQPEMAVWEHLMALHEDQLSEHTALDVEELIGDAGFGAEFHRALILLERLGNGEATVPVDVPAMTQFCATENCTNHTTARYCPACELDRRA